MFTWLKNKLRAKRNGKIIYDYLVSNPLRVVPHDGRVFLQQDDYDKDSEYYKKLVVPYHEHLRQSEPITIEDEPEEIKDYMTSEYVEKLKKDISDMLKQKELDDWIDSLSD